MKFAVALLFVLCPSLTVAGVLNQSPTIDHWGGYFGDAPFAVERADSTGLLVKVGVEMSGSGPIPFERRGAIEFDISAIPAGQQIDSAQVRLHVPSSDDYPQLHIFGYDGNGMADDGDYEVGSLLGAILTVEDGDVIVLDVTSFIQSLYAGASTYAGINLRALFTPLTIREPAMLVSSSEASNPEFWPLLTINHSEAAAVPEPASATLFGLASVVGLGVGAWRKRFRVRTP